MCSMYSDTLTLSSRIINNEGRARAPRAARRGPASAAWATRGTAEDGIKYRLNTKVKPYATEKRDGRYFLEARGAIYAYGFITYFRVGVVCKRLGYWG